MDISAGVEPPVARVKPGKEQYSYACISHEIICIHSFKLNLIVIGTGSCSLGSDIQGVVEDLYQQEAASCSIASD